MNRREEIIAEIRRVSSKLGSQRLSKRQFGQNSRMSSSTVLSNFGSWNRAVEAADLEPIPVGDPLGRRKLYTEQELMVEVIRLTKELGKPPSDREMLALGKFSPRPYSARWGTFAKAREAAYQQLGSPLPGGDETTLRQESATAPPLIRPALVPETIKPKEPRQRKKVQFGEPIDFRGLRFAPINEQGVVYLFGMISRELGFLIESIRTEYPDCEGKRCVDQKDNRWEHVLIEFEYTSSHFQQHGHSPQECDLIVCWIHDWEACPLEVLELKSTIGHLPR